MSLFATQDNLYCNSLKINKDILKALGLTEESLKPALENIRAQDFRKTQISVALQP